MKSKLIHETPRTYAIVLDAGEEVVEKLTSFVKDRNLATSRFTANGAFSEVMLGYFNLKKKDFKRIPLKEQVEVLSLRGQIEVGAARTRFNAHVVVGRSDGSAHGGHLLDGVVRPELVVVLVETPLDLLRFPDERSLIDMLGLTKRDGGRR